jgi:hypothetical protein
MDSEESNYHSHGLSDLPSSSASSTSTRASRPLPEVEALIRFLDGGSPLRSPQPVRPTERPRSDRELARELKRSLEDLVGAQPDRQVRPLVVCGGFPTPGKQIPSPTRPVSRKLSPARAQVEYLRQQMAEMRSMVRELEADW